MKWTPMLVAMLASSRVRVMKRRRRDPQVVGYRGRHITALHPSGMLEVAVDNGHGGITFNRYDDLDDAKAALDEDIEKLGY